MSEDTTTESQEHPKVETLYHYVYGADEEHPVEIDVAVNDVGKVVVFHSHVFKKDLGWFECDLDQGKLFFVFDDGSIVDSAVEVHSMMKKYMQNSHQILTVLLDQETGESKEGHYFPLILHKA
ncbi:MAG: hypothetical protein CMH26_03375 [Micavibrio sp.]|nr:hypothetical protein [Micavibrio sp.]